MANRISTVRTYPLNGAVNFTITFEYLARKFVQVTLIGKDRKELVLNQDYRFTTKTQITTSRTWTAADGYQMIEIRRFTSATDRLVDFADGSILRAYDLNIAQIQTLHVAEEARDLTADTIGVNNDGNLDARGRRIVNVAFATGDYDAVPLKQVKERESSAWNAVTKADEHANRSNKEADRSRDEADRAKREADRSTQQAGVSTQQAVESKKQADHSNSEANRAKGYADSMTASVAEAKKQADRSNSEANRARDEANRAAGEVTKSAAEVAKAAAHVETAKGHADRANTEANRSKSEADRAKSEADKLGNMNDLAGTIESIGSNGKDINFKGGVNGHTLLAKESVHAGVQPNTAFFNDNTLRLRNRDHKERTWDIFAWGNDSGRGNVLEFGTNYGQAWGMYLQFAKGDSQGSHLQVNGAIAARTVYAGGADGGGNNSARLEANGNIVGQGLYFGMGNGQITVDGDITGGIWRNWGNGLWGSLNNNGLFAKPPAGVRLFTGRGPDYLEGSVDGTGVGFRWFNSDRRLKEDIKVVRSADDMLNIIRSYIPVSYKYKNTEYTNNRGVKVVNEGKRSRAGFITQDLIRIWPEVVDTMSDGTQSPDPHQIIGGLMLLVKNMDARLQELEGANK